MVGYGCVCGRVCGVAHGRVWLCMCAIVGTVINYFCLSSRRKCLLYVGSATYIDRMNSILKIVEWCQPFAVAEGVSPINEAPSCRDIGPQS
jgi:hypothetical protein